MRYEPPFQDCILLVIFKRWKLSPAFREIEEQAKSLPPEERARLAESLLESLRQEGIAEVEAAWEQEIRARVAAYKRGEEDVIDAETVLAELRHIAR